METALKTIGKLLVAILFWWDSIFLFIMGFDGTVQYIEQRGLPFPSLVAAGTAIFLLMAPAMLFFRRTAFLGALGLAVFCLMTAVIFHNFWTLDPPDRIGEQISFLKDMALAGALLAIAASAWQPARK